MTEISLPRITYSFYSHGQISTKTISDFIDQKETGFSTPTLFE